MVTVYGAAVALGAIGLLVMFLTPRQTLVLSAIVALIVAAALAVLARVEMDSR